MQEISLIGCLAKYEKKNGTPFELVVVVSMILPIQSGFLFPTGAICSFLSDIFLIRSGFGCKNTAVCIFTDLSHPICLMNVDQSYLVDMEGCFFSG